MFSNTKRTKQITSIFLILSFYSYSEDNTIYNRGNTTENFRITEGKTFYNSATGKILSPKTHGITALKDSKIYNSGLIRNNGSQGIDGDGASTIINEKTGIIDTNGNLGIRLRNGNELINKGEITNNGDYGIASYVTDNVLNEKDAIIKNKGNYGIYLDQSNGTNNGTISNDSSYGALVTTKSNFINNNLIANKKNTGVSVFNSKFENSETGIIKNQGNFGIFLQVDSSVINNGAVSNEGNIGVFVSNSKFENSSSGKIENTGNVGVWVNKKGYAINNGLIANKGDIGVQVENSGTFINHGTISQNGEIAILLGKGDNFLELGTDSKIKGIIEGNKGTDTLILSKSPTSQTSNIDYQIKNFSNIAVKSGEWILNTNLELAVPDKYKDKNTTFSTPPLPASDMTGIFKIEKNKNLVMNIEVSDLLTSTVTTGTLINNGTIIKRPIDSMYITNEKHLAIPTIYINNVKNSNIGNIKIDNIAEGWNGKYYFDKEKGILYLVLDKINESIIGKDIVGGFYESIYNYPKSNVHQLNNLIAKEKNYDLNRKNFIAKNNYKDNFQLIGNYGKYYGNSWHSAYSYNSYGVNGQSNYPINDNLTLGLNYGYIGSKINYKDMAKSKEDIDSFTLIGSISYLNNDWLNTLQASTGYSRHNLKRYILDREDNFNKREIKGNYASNLYSIGWETGYILEKEKNYLYPFVGIDYIWNKDNSYKEKQIINNDEDDYSLNISKDINSSSIFKAGISFDYNFTENFNINGNLQWNHREKNFKDNKANFIFKPNVHYNIPALQTSKDFQILNLTTMYKNNSLTEYFLSLDGIINKKYINTSVSIGMKYKF